MNVDDFSEDYTNHDSMIFINFRRVGKSHVLVTIGESRSQPNLAAGQLVLMGGCTKTSVKFSRRGCAVATWVSVPKTLQCCTVTLFILH